MQITERTIEKEYYKYLVSFIDGGKYKRYSKLLDYLYHTDYIWEYEMDENRAGDGLEFRNYFEMDFHVTNVRISGPCSMLEMMVGLAYRMERELMDDVAYGDRTSQWFWMMINSLGLGYMNNRNFDADMADEIIDTFEHHEYYPNGKGGLFTIEDNPYDLRDEEIWTQMGWFVNDLISKES